MYEELTKRLRFAAQLADKGLVIMPSVCLEAANAIEELSQRSECPCWYGDIRFCSMLGKSIPKPPKNAIIEAEESK